MTTTKAYLTDSETMEGTVRISEILTDTEKPIVRLETTWFHPQGGGQKADRGMIGAHTVLHVAHCDGTVDHYVDSVEGLALGQGYRFSIDRGWRSLNSLFHTAGHLVASFVDAENLGLRAISGHQWPGEARVEFEGDLDVIEQLGRILPQGIESALAAKLPVTIVGGPYDSRAIQIGRFQPIPCGGTHVKSLGEIAQINIVSVKKKGQRIRVSYETRPAV